MAVDPGLQPLVELAVADLAARLNVEGETISVDSALLVSWPDRGFLGPAYLRQIREVPVDGAEIVLTVSGRSFRYRTGGSVYTPVLYEPLAGI